MKLNYDKKSDIIDFGKYKGKTIGFLFNWDIDYIEWCMAEVKGFKLGDRLRKAVDKVDEEKRDKQRKKRMKKTRKISYSDMFDDC